LSLSRGDIDRAKAIALEQLEILDTLEEESDDLEHGRDIAFNADLLGRIEYARGALDTARSYHERQTALLSRLFDQYPEDPNLPVQLIWARINLADVDKDDGDFVAAISGYSAARELARQRSEQSSDDINIQFALGAAEQRLGDIYLARMQTEEAEQAYASVVSIFKELSDNNPNSVFWRRNIAVGKERLGRLYATGIAESIRLMTQLAASVAADGDDWNLSFALIADEKVWAQLERSFEMYSASSDIVGALIDADASVPEWHQDLAAHHVGMAQFTLTAGNAAAAREHIDKAREIVTGLIEQGYDDVFTHRSFLETWQASGRLNLLSGDSAAARQDFDEALARAKSLIETTKQESTWLEYVAESYDGIGDSAYFRADFEQAETAYAQALAIRDKLAIEVPDHVLWQLQQAVAAYKLAALESRASDDSPTQAHDDALVLFNRLDRAGHLPVPVALTLQQVESHRH